MSTDYFFTNKTNTEVKRLDLTNLGKQTSDNNYITKRMDVFWGNGSANQTGSVNLYKYFNNSTWFYQEEKMTWAKNFGENNSEPLLNKIAEWLDINWHSEHSELPEIQTFIEQYDLWSTWQKVEGANHSRWNKYWLIRPLQKVEDDG